jgi:hypothetical protein
MSEQTLPTDHFSRRLRELTHNPGAVRATSTIQTADFYGNAETWVVDTFRVDGGEEVLVQRISSAGGLQLVLPPAVTAAMSRQRDRAVKSIRRTAARSAVATKRAAGIPIGNADALRKARKAKR